MLCIKVLSPIKLGYDSTQDDETPKRYKIHKNGAMLKFDMETPNGNVWFIDSDAERGKILCGSFKSLLDSGKAYCCDCLDHFAITRVTVDVDVAAEAEAEAEAEGNDASLDTRKLDGEPGPSTHPTVEPYKLMNALHTCIGQLTYMTDDLNPDAQVTANAGKVSICNRTFNVEIQLSLTE